MGKNFYEATIQYFDCKNLDFMRKVANQNRGCQIRVIEESKLCQYGFNTIEEMSSFAKIIVREEFGDLIKILNYKNRGFF